MPNLTQQQQAIISAARDTDDSLLVEARAGSGKTFTLLQLLEHLRGNTCLMAFNKSIAKELETRTVNLPFETRMSLTIGTVHSLGLRAYQKGEGIRPRINGGKVAFIHKDLCQQRKSLADLFRPIGYTIQQIVSGAKNNGFGVQAANEQFPDASDDNSWMALMEHHNWDLELAANKIAPEVVIDHCRRLLELSNLKRNSLDFDDMIYLPLLFNHKLPTYNNVLIDEAQDISATRRELAFRSMADSGRMIAVGDEFQAIYGFTGADASSLPNIAKRAQATKLALTTCWRCDGDIINEAQRLVPDISARPDAPAGLVDHIDASTVETALLAQIPVEKIQQLQAANLIPAPGDAILCRLNRPNVSMALALLRAGIRARIEGRDLGKRLLSYVKQSNPRYAFISLAELAVDLETWGSEQSELLASKQRLSAAALLDDEVAAASLLIERAMQLGGNSYTALESLVTDLFDDDIPPTGVVTLSSVHKAKGREWPHVFLLGRADYMPFFRAEQDWELQQEKNLIYVAVTRAERHLTYITDVAAWIDSKKGS